MRISDWSSDVCSSDLFTSGRHKRMSRDRTAHQAKARGGCMDEFSIYALNAVALWLVLQLLALWQLSGMWRTAAWLSAAVMGLALVVASLGVPSGSKPATIWVVSALPVFLFRLGLLWISRGARHDR